MEQTTRCDDCGTALGEIQIRVSDNLPVCEDCFLATQPKQSSSRSSLGYQRDKRTETQDASYWRGMYKVMVRILAEQHDDPCIHWLDEVTRYKATRLH